jgi:glycosyltransferase involved in cell wall biosynthesis
MTPIAINGRFLTQGMTGVQRFAREITAAADRLAGNDAWPRARLLLPGTVTKSPFAYFHAKPVGKKSGQIWEQWELPKAAKGSFLINLGNTAPLMTGNAQAVVIHDAGVFDTPESYSLAFRSWYRFLHKRLALSGAQLLTVSEFSCSRFAQALGVPADTIGVLPEGGDHMLRIAGDAGILARHGLEAQRYAVVVGNPAAHKNLAALTRAAALLGRRGLTLAVAGAANAAVFRAGGGPAAGAGRLLGRVSDAELRALYENALCLIFPSRYEGFGLPPLEAMTCGCPVVAAHAGAVPEVCGEAALWFDPMRPETLGEALVRLLDEEGLAVGMREAGLKRAAFYTWEKASLALLSLIRRNAL